MNVSFAHINAYIKGHLSAEGQKLIENEVDKNPDLLNLIERKKEELTLLESIIPSLEVTSKHQQLVYSDLELISEEIIQEEKKSVLERVAKVLDTTIIEF